jgi:hypothetical protein
MYIKYFFTLFGLALFFNTHAQLQNPYRFEQVTNLDLGVRSESILLQLDYQHIHRLNPENRFRMGYGVGLIRFRGFDNIAYTTQGAAENINVGLDTFQVVDAKITSLNLFLLLNYAPNNRIDFGFSIDVLGLSWGDTQRGLFATGPDDPNPVGAEGEPEKFNSSLVGSGSWRSQFHLRYWVYPRWALHTGLNYWLSTYKITEDIGLDRDTFNQGQLFWKIGLGFRWGKLSS